MYEKDTVTTAAGDLEITCIGHGTLMLTLGERVIHVDPVSREADYATMPDADLVLVTHEHGDHLDAGAIAAVSKPGTIVAVSASCEGRLQDAIVLRNGNSTVLAGIPVEAVPAYNIVHKRGNGQPFHPKGNGNGYILTFGDTRVFIAGDTENTPEIKALRAIDVAFLPMNLPYTMTPEMVADVARAMRPKILYPYHFGSTDTAELVSLLKEEKDIEVRIRKLD
jgi:L-ascorbate metabolism protein UlaG (beta-lactamase superfamily)